MSGFKRRRNDDDSDLWSSVSDLFGAMTLIFLVLFMLAAALVGDPSVTTIRAELVKIKKKNIVLIDEVERLEKELARRKKEDNKHKKKADEVVSLSAVEWAVVMKAQAKDPMTSRYELMVIDPLGGRISNSYDKSIMLSNRGASWISAGAEQIVAQDADSLSSGSVYEGTYKVFLVYQKGNEDQDGLSFKLGKKSDSGGMQILHQETATYDRIQPLEKSTRIFQFDVDSGGGISNIKKF